MSKFDGLILRAYVNRELIGVPIRKFSSFFLCFFSTTSLLPWIVLKHTEIDNRFRFVEAERSNDFFWTIPRPVLQVADGTGVEID